MMADLKIVCPDCDKTLTISEFVDDSALTCRECGTKLTRPARNKEEKPKPKLSATVLDGERETEEEGDEQPRKTNALFPGKKALSKAEMKAQVRHHPYALILFIVLGVVMGYLRYGDILPARIMAREQAYAMYGLLLLHGCVVLKAFEDTVFQGILCLLVPFYSVYYIAAVSDSVYLRALIGAVAIGIGQDGAEDLQSHLFQVCKTVNEWIGSGGGPV